MKMYNHDEPATTLRYVCWENDDAEKERSRAMADISAQIVDNARVHIEAAQFQADYNRETPVLPKMLGIEVKK